VQTVAFFHLKTLSQKVASKQRIQKHKSARSVRCRMEKFHCNLIVEVVYTNLTVSCVHGHWAPGNLSLFFYHKRSCRSVEVGPVKAVCYAAANGREAVENVVYSHLQSYRVNLFLQLHGKTKHGNAFAPCYQRIHESGIVQFVPFFAFLLSACNN